MMMSVIRKIKKDLKNTLKIKENTNYFEFEFKEPDGRFINTYYVKYTGEIQVIKKDIWNDDVFFVHKDFRGEPLELYRHFKRICRTSIAKMGKSKDPNLTLYRVMQREGEEDYYDILMPGSSTSYTGFWTPYKEVAFSLIYARNEALCEIDGGCTSSIIVTTTLGNVVVNNQLGKTLKSGHNLSFDKDEYFITKIKDIGKVRQL